MWVPVSELVLAQSLGRVRVLEPEQVQVQVLVSGQATAQE